MNLNYQTALSCAYSCRDIGKGNIQGEMIRSNETGAEAAVSLDRDLRLIKIVFKGSKELEDWETDSRIIQKTIGYRDDKRIKMHSGFHDAVLSILPGVRNALLDSTLMNDGYITILCGHSLGEALAKAYAYVDAEALYLTLRRNPIDAIVGFGGPHLGNEGLQADFEDRYHHVFNFRNEHDIVPRLLDNIPGYCHVGTFGDQEKITLPDIIFNGRKPDNIPAAVADHDIVRDYILPLERGAADDGIHEAVI